MLNLFVEHTMLLSGGLSVAYVKHVEIVLFVFIVVLIKEIFLHDATFS